MTKMDERTKKLYKIAEKMHEAIQDIWLDYLDEDPREDGIRTDFKLYEKDAKRITEMLNNDLCCELEMKSDDGY